MNDWLYQEINGWLAGNVGSPSGRIQAGWLVGLWCGLDMSIGMGCDRMRKRR